MVFQEPLMFKGFENHFGGLYFINIFLIHVPNIYHLLDKTKNTTGAASHTSRMACKASSWTRGLKWMLTSPQWSGLSDWMGTNAMTCWMRLLTLSPWPPLNPRCPSNNLNVPGILFLKSDSPLDSRLMT